MRLATLRYFISPPLHSRVPSTNNQQATHETMLLRVFSVCLLASYVSTEEKAGETCSEATDTDVSDLVRVYENIANEQLLTSLHKEVMWLHSLAVKGKSTTVWIPKETWEKPKDQEFALEHALRNMYAAEGSDSRVAGAEVWVHHRNVGDWRIGGPHFDKDEVNYKAQFARERDEEGKAADSASRSMVFPLRGTITYMTSCGGPTVVYNQTLSTGLESLSPYYPAEAAVSWPKKGKHMTFNGQAYHQVRNDPVLALNPECGSRTVLLVNWWDHKVPREEFTHDWAREHGLTPARSIPSNGEDASALPVASVVVDEETAATEHSVPMYPASKHRSGERTFHYRIPNSGACRGTCVARWEGKASRRGVPILDMLNRFVLQDAFTVVEGTLTMLLMVHADEVAAAADFAPLEGELEVKMFVVDAAQSPGFLSLAGIPRDELPTAVVLDAQNKLQRLRPGIALTADALRSLAETMRADDARSVPMHSPFLNTVHLDMWASFPLDVELCTVRAQQRLLHLSRGTRSRCAYLLRGGADEAALGTFREGVDAWEQKELRRAWDFFGVAESEEEGLPEKLGLEKLPKERPLIVVNDPEFSTVKTWSIDSDEKSPALADWLKSIDEMDFE